MLAPLSRGATSVRRTEPVVSLFYIPGVVKAADLLARPTLSRYANWQQRIERALQHARELRRYARQVSPTHYKVKSQSKPGVWYDVYVTDEGFLLCTCPAGEWHHPCKHAGRVALRREREYRMPRLSDLPATPWDLFGGDEIDSPSPQSAHREPVPPADYYRIA
jgi:hypothetical protein